MPRRDKLIQRIVARPPEASFADVRAVFEQAGWILHRTKGSHHIFVKEGERSMTIPVVDGRRVKRTY